MSTLIADSLSFSVLYMAMEGLKEEPRRSKWKSKIYTAVGEGLHTYFPAEVCPGF